MAAIPKSKTTNKVLFDTVRDLKKYSTKTKTKLWRAVAADLAKTASQRSQVNVSKIEKHSKAGETVIIGGKVLGDGIISKKVTVVAFNASETAKTKISKAGGKFIEIRDFLATNPKGKTKILR